MSHDARQWAASSAWPSLLRGHLSLAALSLFLSVTWGRGDFVHSQLWSSGERGFANTGPVSQAHLYASLASSRFWGGGGRWKRCGRDVEMNARRALAMSFKGFGQCSSLKRFSAPFAFARATGGSKWSVVFLTHSSTFCGHVTPLPNTGGNLVTPLISAPETVLGLVFIVWEGRSFRNIV